MEYGPDEQKIVLQCLREHMPFPDFIKNAPELGVGLQLFFTAFTDLSTTRNMGMDEGPISWAAIQEYIRWAQLDDDQAEALHFHVRGMDVAYLKFRGRKHEGH
jgi:hypothetical protein